MKTSRFIKVSALLVSASLAAALAGPAAANISTGNLAVDIQSAIGSEGNVNVRLVDGVVTLTGYVNSATAEQAAKSAAMNFEGVNRVIDLISHD